jgi:hypothetical protein
VVGPALPEEHSMSSEDIQLLASAWSDVATAVTSEMYRLEKWPSASLRHSRLERTRGEPDSLFAYLDKLEFITPKLAAAIVGMGTGLSVQPLYDLVDVTNGGLESLLASQRSPDMSCVGRAFRLAGQLVNTVRALAAAQPIIEQPTANKNKTPDKNPRPKKTRGPKPKVAQNIRQAILKVYDGGESDRHEILATVRDNLGIRVKLTDVITVLNTRSKQKTRSSR